MSAPIAIEPVTPERLPVLADVVGRAFRDDPMILWPLRAAPDLQERIIRFFAATYGVLLDRGSLWEAGDGLGFANWMPPGEAIDALETSDELDAVLADIGDGGAACFETLWTWIEHRIPGDVWYLDMIGVDPTHQGRGVGSALIRFGLERASVSGADAFLETSVAGNVPLYERFGFHVVEEGEPADGLHIWFMRTRA